MELVVMILVVTVVILFVFMYIQQMRHIIRGKKIKNMKKQIEGLEKSKKQLLAFCIKVIHTVEVDVLHRRMWVNDADIEDHIPDELVPHLTKITQEPKWFNIIIANQRFWFSINERIREEQTNAENDLSNNNK